MLDPVAFTRRVLRPHLRDVKSIELADADTVLVTVEFRRSNARVQERCELAARLLREHGIGLTVQPTQDEYQAADPTYDKTFVPVHWTVKSAIGWPGRD